MSERPIRRALLSVSDKTGIVEFARGLAAFGVEILSTGGTARTLSEAGIDIVEVDQFTGFPEMLDGRVKTLHPRVHAGILHRRDDPEHVSTMKEHGLAPIDLVAVSLYPFVETISKPDVTLEEAIEQIDIGGPSMLRSAAKNHADVTVVCRPERYHQILAAMEGGDGGTTLDLRRELAIEVFASTHAYDGAISGYLAKAVSADSVPPAEDSMPPARLARCLPRARVLRYGENPHQKAAIYGSFLEQFEQLHGKEISYNNVFDLCAALDVVTAIAARAESHPAKSAAVSIIKHANPCGAAVGDSLADAWSAALACDPQSASGGIIGCSKPIDVAAAEAMSGHFIEVVVAPGFEPKALEILGQKKNRILLRQDVERWGFKAGELILKSVPGGIVAQTADVAPIEDSEFRVVTKRAPTDGEMAAMRFGWDIVPFVKSNAILYCGPDRLLGVGAGQMSRVDSARIAASKAASAKLDLAGSAVISDAFFPFADGLLTAIDAGATCAIQPGGSVRDEEVIAAADERGISMVFTGRRHFRH
jgi:phosphoribosylaminoimidazolecarboxamide formyltransferase/IMP cyclohydrolase